MAVSWLGKHAPGRGQKNAQLVGKGNSTCLGGMQKLALKKVVGP